MPRQANSFINVIRLISHIDPDPLVTAGGCESQKEESHSAEISGGILTRQLIIMGHDESPQPRPITASALRTGVLSILISATLCAMPADSDNRRPITTNSSIFRFARALRLRRLRISRGSSKIKVSSGNPRVRSVPLKGYWYMIDTWSIRRIAVSTIRDGLGTAHRDWWCSSISDGPLVYDSGNIYSVYLYKTFQFQCAVYDINILPVIFLIHICARQIDLNLYVKSPLYVKYI